MPTGYTAKIADGISFREFALDCARAFGACVLLRDEPGGGEAIPDEFKPSDYHVRARETAEKELARLESMSASEREAEAENAHFQAEKSRKASLLKNKALRVQYENMLDAVIGWEPPTNSHKGLKEFMRQQITESIDFDCNDDYYDKPTERISGEEWAAQRRVKLARDIEYHIVEYRKEVDRTNERNEWIRALRLSLPTGATSND